MQLTFAARVACSAGLLTLLTVWRPPFWMFWNTDAPREGSEAIVSPMLKSVSASGPCLCSSKTPA